MAAFLIRWQQLSYDLLSTGLEDDHTGMFELRAAATTAERTGIDRPRRESER